MIDYLKSGLEQIPTPVAIVSKELKLVACSSAYQELARIDGAVIGQPMHEILPGSTEDQTQRVQASFDRVLKTGQSDHLPFLQYAVREPDGEFKQRYWSVSNKPLRGADGSVIGLLHCPTEITELVQLRNANHVIQQFGVDEATRGELHRWTESLQSILHNERQRLHQLFQQAPGFVAVLKGPNFVFELANNAYYQLVGHRSIIGRPLVEVMPEVVGQGYVEILDRVFTTGEPFVGRAMPIELQRVADEELALRYMDLTYQPMVDADARVTGIFVQGNDVTETHLLAQEVTYHASHDWLTGLHNRREFARQTGRIEGSGKHAVLYMDIDHFKIVNDRCGHGAGDELLVMVAQRLQAATDDTRDLLARLGGDEFALLRRNCGLREALDLAEELRATVRDAAFTWHGQRYSVTLSIGAVSFGHKDLPEFGAALALADAACFLAKEKGRNRVQAGRVSDEEIQQRQHDMDSVTRLKEAMSEDRLLLYGQKLRALQETTVQTTAHCEVLVRLRERDGTITLPGAFIPAAERFGVIEEVDRHIVLKIFARIAAEAPDDRGKTCYFVNLSGITLSAPGFLDFIDGALTGHPGVDPANICFEVTETAALSNIYRTAQAMSQLSGLGFRFALDDFGSGMASFNYLQELPVHFVKIDGKFIKTLSDKPVSRIFVEAVAKVARTMNMQTVAESVECEAITAQLSSMGLDYAQGYALHVPEPL